jgi:DnaJ-class molecular chaperone
MVIDSTCEQCHGTGGEYKKCDKCETGFEIKNSKIKATVPAGIKNETILKLKDKGNTIYYKDKKHTGSIFILIDYATSKNGVTLKNGKILATTHVPFDSILNEKTIQVDILGCKTLEVDLKQSQTDYTIPNGGAADGKDAEVKVIIDIPKKKISTEQKAELIKLLKDIYGEPTTTFSTAPDYSTAT